MKLHEPLTPIAYPSTIEELAALRIFHNKEICPQMVGIHAINSGVLHNSPSRSVMMSQHITQHLIFLCMEPPITMAGLEYDLGKYTFGIRMPENGKIVKTIQRYGVGAGSNGVNGQPEITIIYQKEDNHQLDVFHIKQWGCFHQYFGYRHKVKPGFNMLRPNVYIPKDTTFADSPAVEDDGHYNYGSNFEVAAMDVPGVADDGIIISESAAEKMKTVIYETRDFSFGSKDFPVGFNGGEDEYKVFQDIGEYIRHDGLIMATRSYSERMAPAIMGAKNLRTVDHIFDQKLYSRETSLKNSNERFTKKAGKIVDIQVIKNNESSRHLPPTMTKQLDRYAKALKTYYSELLECETRLSMENRRNGGDGKLFISPELQNLLTRARAITGQGGNRFQGNISLQYRRTPLDEYNVTFVIEHELTPNLGWKCTGLDGDKGVVCGIWKDEDMPVDEAGNRAEMIVSSNSTIQRSNWGRSFKPYFSAAARDLTKELRKFLGVTEKVTEEQIELIDPSLFDQAWTKLLGYYAIVSPQSFWYYNHHLKDISKKQKHLTACLKKTIRNYMPVDNPINDIDAVLHLEKHYPQTYGPVTYKALSGRMEKTKSSVRIAPMYMMLLEKIADDGSSTSIGKLQHHGILASQTKSEKYSLPYRSNSTRTTGEAEAKLYLFYSRTIRAIAEIIDQSNNPTTMRWISRTLLGHPTPSNIDVIVDRKIIPYGNTRPIQFLQHFMATQGAWIDYMPEEEAFNLGMTEIFDVR